MCFSDWQNFCLEAWQIRYTHIRIDKNKGPDDMFSIKNVSPLELAAVAETTAC